MIVPCDQPEIDTAIIERVASAWRSVPHAIVVASYHGVLGHPFVFDRRMFPELAVLHGDKAAWRLIDRYRDRIYTIELKRPAPRNINTLEDYVSLTDQLSPSRPRPGHDARGDGHQQGS
jgi:molybdenum cofactor cytidylyltransferase